MNQHVFFRKRPMDLSTLEGNLKANKYANAFEFYNDLQLIFGKLLRTSAPTCAFYLSNTRVGKKRTLGVPKSFMIGYFL